MTTEALGGGEPALGVPRASVGPYRLVQQIGEGGMGVVHLALDPHGRAVALKLLRPHIALDGDARTRLAREIDILGRVRTLGSRRCSTPTSRATSRTLVRPGPPWMRWSASTAR